MGVIAADSPPAWDMHGAIAGPKLKRKKKIHLLYLVR